MARLSGYLTGRMANPTYGGMLGRNIQGGMQGISDAISQRKQRDAYDSMTSMLTAGDANDPRVVESVQAVARQMNVDPLQAQKLIDNAQAQKLRQEQAERAKSTHQMMKATHQYNQTVRAQKTADDNAIKAVMAVYSKDPEAARAALDKLPPERQEAAAQALAKRIQYDAQLKSWEDAQTSREPFSQTQLDSMAKLPGMETAIETYETMKKEPGAKANLMRQYSSAFQASLYASPKDDIKAWELKAANELVAGADWGIIGTGYNIPNRHYGQVAHAVAVYTKNTGKAPTPDQVREIAQTVMAEEEKKEEGFSPKELNLIEQASERYPDKSQDEIIEALKKQGLIDA